MFTATHMKMISQKAIDKLLGNLQGISKRGNLLFEKKKKEA